MTSSPPDPPDGVDDEGATASADPASTRSGGSLAPRIPSRYLHPDDRTDPVDEPPAPEPEPAPVADPTPATDPLPVADQMPVVDQTPVIDPPPVTEPELGTDDDTDDSDRVPLARRLRPSRPPAWVAVAAVGVAGVIALVVLLTLAVIDQHARSAKDARRQAVTAAARQEVLNLLNLSGKDLPTAQGDLDRLLSGATGNFRSQFTAAGLAQSLVTAKANLSGQVDVVGINSLSRNTAQVLVAAESTETTSTQKTALSQLNRFIVVLQRQGGKWVVSDLGSVG